MKLTPSPLVLSRGLSCMLSAMALAVMASASLAHAGTDTDTSTATSTLQSKKADNVTVEQIHQGIWKIVVGAPEAYDLLKAANAKPYLKGLERKSDQAFPFALSDLHTHVYNGRTNIRIPLGLKENLYGFGLNFKTVNQTQKSLELHVDHYAGKDTGRTHAPVPFYVSDAGYGVLINSARYIKVNTGVGVRTDDPNQPRSIDRNSDQSWDSMPRSSYVDVLIHSPGTEIYVFAGDSMLDVVERYNLFNGGGVLPPKWGLGFTHRTPTLYSQADVVKEVAQFEQHEFPLSFIGIEPGWHSKAYPNTYDWSKKRFPKPQALAEQLLEKGVRMNLWINPYISDSSSLYSDLLPLSGSHKVWNGIVPDVSLAQTQAIFKQRFDQHIEMGVSGYKIDEVDGYDKWLFPDQTQFPSGNDGETMRQTYGVQMQKMTTDLFREHNQRTYGLVRASNAGTSAMPYVLYNDYYDHRDFVTALVNSSFSGLLWTPEVRASKSESSEEWLRRMQSVSFSPMAMLNAWASGTKPWSYPDVYPEVQAVANLRMQLLPYLYSSFAQYRFEGTPPFRAMYLEEGFNVSDRLIAGDSNLEENPYALAKLKEVKDQYMMGDSILVAPMFTGETQRDVILPTGDWFDFYTGEKVGNGEVITVKPGQQTPLFVKDGGIIPMMPVVRHWHSDAKDVPLEVRVYGNKGGEFQLYDDDGQTFDHESGEWSLLKLQARKQGQRWTTNETWIKQGYQSGFGAIRWIMMTK